uniref:Uncharacterized protein n=1 Tax=Megaselia scalaris TaxID=36166 RepID=T1GQZ2_MEGSC
MISSSISKVYEISYESSRLTGFFFLFSFPTLQQKATKAKKGKQQHKLTVFVVANSEATAKSRTNEKVRRLFLLACAFQMKYYFRKKLQSLGKLQNEEASSQAVVEEVLPISDDSPENNIIQYIECK